MKTQDQNLGQNLDQCNTNMESADLKIVILSRITFSDEEICGLGVSGHPSASMVIDDIYGPYRGFLSHPHQKLVLIVLNLVVRMGKKPP